MTALVVDGLTAGHAGVPAVRGVTFSCEPGEVLSILGPNGAGKSTTLLTVGGCLRPMTGTVRVFGTDVTGRAPHQVGRQGLILVPDDRGVFPGLTVAEHLSLAERSIPARRGTGVRITREQLFESFPALEALMGRRCGLLSGGEQQMLAISKALLLSPRVLLVDELSLGLAPIVVRALLPRLSTLARESGMALVLVEQHFELALASSNHALIMNHGQVVLAAPAAALLADPQRVERAYFGAA